MHKYFFGEIYASKPHLLATIVVEMFTITYFVFASVLEPFWGERNILLQYLPDGLEDMDELVLC